MNKHCLILAGSAGAITGVIRILKEIKTLKHIAIIVLIHVKDHTHFLLPSVIKSQTNLDPIIPKDGEIITPGSLYVSPPMYHLQVEPDQTFSYTVDAPMHYSRPSIDVLLMTASDAFKENLTVMMLSGASSDGAKGAVMVLKKQGKVFVENPLDAEVKIMPKAVINASKDAKICDFDMMIQAIKETEASYEQNENIVSRRS